MILSYFVYLTKTSLVRFCRRFVYEYAIADVEHRCKQSQIHSIVDLGRRAIQRFHHCVEANLSVW